MENSGRKMDAAWRQAISEGLRKARGFARDTGDSAASLALKAMPKNEGTRARIAGALSGSNNGLGLMSDAIVPVMGGGMAGGALGGALNKWAMKQKDVMTTVAAKNPKLAAALNKSLATGKGVKLDNATGLHKALGGRVAAGAVAGAKVGARVTATRTIPVIGAALGVGGAILGARDKKYGEKSLAAMKARAARHEAKKTAKSR